MVETQNTTPAENRALIERETTARVVKAALWVALVQAQRAGWPDVTDELLRLHHAADQRLRAAEYGRWYATVETDGPNQPHEAAA